MQTFQVIQTIKWIKSLVSPEVNRALFTWELAHETASTREQDPSITAAYLKATHELTRITETIIQNPYAVEVLKNFGLESLTDRDFSSTIAIGVVNEGTRHIEATLRQLVYPWRLMTSCVEPLEQLTIPEEMRSEVLSDEILTLKIQYREAETPSLDKISTAFESLESAYSSIAKIYGMEKEAGHLQVLKIESGSAVRVDCKGLGLVVKHLKEFFIEAWHKFRHKRPEEIIENNRAVLSTVAAVQQIESSVQNKTMSREQGEILKRKMIEETLGLFGSGALIIEIPQREILDNTKLLRDFSTKLLMAPKDSAITSDSKDAGEDHGESDISVINSEDSAVSPSPRSTKKRSTKKKSPKKTQKRKNEPH